jgi:hypothetical protein
MFATKVVSSPYGPPARVKTMRPVSPAIAGVGDDWSVGRAVCGAVPVGARVPPVRRRSSRAQRTTPRPPTGCYLSGSRRPRRQNGGQLQTRQHILRSPGELSPALGIRRISVIEDDEEDVARGSASHGREVNVSALALGSAVRLPRLVHAQIRVAEGWTTTVLCRCRG